MTVAVAGAVALWTLPVSAQTGSSSPGSSTGSIPSGTSGSSGTGSSVGSSGTSSSPSSAASLASQDAILKQDGTVYFLKQGRPQKVEREMRLAEGVTIQSDGDVILKDGARVTLKDGQLITLDGRIMTAPAGILQQQPDTGSR